MIKNTLATNQIPVLQLINQLLEFYGERKADQHFGPLGYQSMSDPLTKKYDYSLHSPSLYFNQLLFEFVVRRGDPLSDRQFFWDRLRRFQSFSEQYFFFFIVFTDLNPAGREAARARFSNWLREDTDITHLADRIMFLPINFSELSSIQNGFSIFSNQYVKRSWDMVFTAQPSPYGYHARNDHELDEFIEFKKYNLRIDITPGNSKFWRFGLRFLKEKRLPPRNQDRHADSEIADICLCAGDAKLSDNGYHLWNHPEQLALSAHHISSLEAGGGGVNSYNQNSVTLIIFPENNGQRV
ncbi:MAG TPA: hypothetical protein VG605_20065, partial [Puia sp.]|nr:hypothetical protein [Puia sp.]